MENPHKHHRERLKRRFLTSGLDDFEPHNILELLLFFGIPQGDVNPTAHALMDRFKTLDAVFDADIEELCKVNGIGSHSATLIKLMPELFKAYSIAKSVEKDKLRYDTDEFLRFIVANAMNKSTECVWLYLFNNKKELISFKLIHEGSVNSVSFSLRSMLEEAIKTNASEIIIAHNHPDGIAFPSDDDVHTTHSLGTLMGSASVVLREHYIVAGSSVCGILDGGPAKNMRLYRD